MNKVRAKISGGFRAYNPAKEFMSIRSFIHIAIKQNQDPLELLRKVFQGDDAYMNLVYTD